MNIESRQGTGVKGSRLWKKLNEYSLWAGRRLRGKFSKQGSPSSIRDNSSFTLSLFVPPFDHIRIILLRNEIIRCNIVELYTEFAETFRVDSTALNFPVRLPFEICVVGCRCCVEIEQIVSKIFDCAIIGDINVGSCGSVDKRVVGSSKNHRNLQRENK